jgi:muramoyltetrapeptide carboxypeptidase
LRKPDRIQPGDTIGIVTPASPSPKEELDKGVAVIEARGYRVKLATNLCAKASHCDYLAGSDRERAEDLNAMFGDPEIKAVFCGRGGYGSMRLFDLLDWSLIEANAKLFVGYSDITSLHTAFSRLGWVTLHATMVSSLWRLSDDALSRFWHLVESPDALGQLPTEGANIETVVPGSVEGELAGGNLCLLAQACGSRFAPDFRGKIVAIEDTNDAVYHADRELTQLLNAGHLQDAEGFIIGTLSGWEKHEADPPINTPSALWSEFFGRLGRPCISGFPFGHIPNPLMLPLGVRARLDAERRIVELLEGAVV